MSAPLEELLAIDVEAELRKLGSAQLAQPGQLAAELVRLALRRGAREIAVEIGARQLRVSDDAPPLPEAALAALHTLADGHASPGARHEALVALEHAGLEALVGAASACGGRCTSGPGWLALHHPAAPASQARAFLRAVTRFAPAIVWLDGQRVPGSGAPAFHAACARRALSGPLSGDVAWTGRRDGAQVWLLAGGVLASHLHLPEAPALEAVVETDPLCRRMAGVEERRDAVRARVEALVRQAIALLVDACAAFDQLDPLAQRHLRRELLHAVELCHEQEGLLQAPAFPALVPPDGARRCSSLFELRAAAASARPARCLSVAEPGLRAADLTSSAQPVFLLDADERSRLAEWAGVRFTAATLRRPPSRLSTARRALLALVRRLWANLTARGAPLADGELLPAERALRAALESELRASPEWPVSEVRLRSGRGAPRLRSRAAGLCLELPRALSSVRAARRAVSADARWAYAAALALLHEAGWRRR